MTAGDQHIDRRRKVPAATRTRLTLWRLLIAACGAAGLAGALSAGGVGTQLEALSQQASLATVVVYLGLAAYPYAGERRLHEPRLHEPRSPWWRGELAVTLLIVLAVYQTLLGGDLAAPHSLFEHLLTPLAVTVDVLFVGRDLLNARWWSVLSWLAFPLAYLIYYNAFSLDIYSFPLRVTQPGFLRYLPALLGGALAVGAVLVAAGRLRARRAAGIRR